MRMLLAFLLLAQAEETQGVGLPEQRHGDVVARLHVIVGEQSVSPGRAQARYRITIEGPPTLQVESPRLEDAFAAWRIPRQCSSWSADRKAHIEWVLELAQTKSGVVPPPGVRLRVRGGPEGVWDDVYWPDPLHATREVPPVVEVQPVPPSPWPDRLRWMALMVAGCLAGLLFARRVQRWRTAQARPQTTSERALAQLALPDIGIDQITAIVRTILEERVGLPASRMTTGELLGLLKQQDKGEYCLDRLRELLELGDLVKFAGQPFSPAEIARSRQLAREVVEAIATWPTGETVSTAQGG